MGLKDGDFSTDFTGKIVIISGASGSGKSTLVNRFMAFTPAGYRVMRSEVVGSHTTRSKRRREFAGEYFHLTDQELDELWKNERVAWEVQVHSARYATLKYRLASVWHNRVLGLVNATPSVVLALPASLIESGFITPVFIKAPCGDELRRRLEQRGGMKEEELSARIADCREWNKILDQPGGERFHELDGNLPEDELERQARDIIG